MQKTQTLLSKEDLKDYDLSLTKDEMTAYEYVEKSLREHLEIFPDMKPENIRELAIELVEEAVRDFGDMASSRAADLYEELHDVSGSKTKGAIIDDSDVSHYINDEVRWQVKKYIEGDIDGFIRGAASCAKEQVGRRANETMRRSVERDRGLYARVPLGIDTCTFCAMLAANGFWYSSRKSAGGEGNHFHKNCRCKIVPYVKGIKIEGYDPAEWDARWRGYKKLDETKGITKKERKAAKEELFSIVSGEHYGKKKELDKHIDESVNAALRRTGSRVANYGKWENPAVSSIASVEEIEAYIKENYGAKVSDEFKKLDLDTQKEIVAGIDYTISKYGKGRIYLIDTMRSKVYEGTYDPASGIIYINAKVPNPYITSIHETAHSIDAKKSCEMDEFIDAQSGKDYYVHSKKVLEEARKSVGLRKNSKKYNDAVFRIMRGNVNTFAADHDKYHEVVSYAIDYEASGYSNELSKAISERF